MPITMFSESLIDQISIDAWEEDELDLSSKLDSSGGESNYLTLENIRNLVKAINKNTRIKKLILQEQELNDECVIELAKINSPSLVALDLYNNDITALGVQALANNKNFTWLSLSYNGLSDEDIAPLAHNKKLTYLDLALNEITDEGGKLLIEADTALEGIDLGAGDEEKIGKETIKALAKNTKIKILSLRSQKLGDENIKYLLKNNKHLTDLNLGRNNLTDAITPSLLKHPCLTTVDLSYNDGITNITADQIYQHLEKIPLVRLNTNCTDISTSWEKYLQELLADKAKKASGSKKRTLLGDAPSNGVPQESNQSLTLNGSGNEKFQPNQKPASHESADQSPEPESKKARLSDARRTSTSVSETTPSTTNSPVLSSLSSASSSTVLSENANSLSPAIESIQSKITFFNLSTSSSVGKNALQADTDQQKASEHKVNEEVRGVIK